HEATNSFVSPSTKAEVDAPERSCVTIVQLRNGLTIHFHGGQLERGLSALYPETHTSDDFVAHSASLLFVGVDVVAPLSNDVLHAEQLRHRLTQFRSTAVAHVGVATGTYGM